MGPIVVKAATLTIQCWGKHCFQLGAAGSLAVAEVGTRRLTSVNSENACVPFQSNKSVVASLCITFILGCRVYVICNNVRLSLMWVSTSLGGKPLTITKEIVFGTHVRDQNSLKHFQTI